VEGRVVFNVFPLLCPQFVEPLQFDIRIFRILSSLAGEETVEPRDHLVDLPVKIGVGSVDVPFIGGEAVIAGSTFSETGGCPVEISSPKAETP